MNFENLTKVRFIARLFDLIIAQACLIFRQLTVLLWGLFGKLSKIVHCTLLCDPVPPLLAHSWHVLSCRYLALTTVEICPIFRKRWKQLRHAENIKKHTIYLQSYPAKARERGEVGGQAVIYNLKVSVSLDYQGMPGGASASLLHFIYARGESGENAGRLCKFCICRWW